MTVARTLVDTRCLDCPYFEPRVTCARVINNEQNINCLTHLKPQAFNLDNQLIAAVINRLEPEKTHQSVPSEKGSAMIKCD